jgi:ribonuclease HI
MQADADAKFDLEAAVREECGRVITNPNQAEHLGATRATNNTGELGAVYHALTSARELVRPSEEVLILSDSQIAICTTTGAWVSRKNKALVERNRRALRAAGTTVRFQHIRAHAGHGMNERADRLAARGAQGMRCRRGMIYVPTDGGGRGHTGAASTLRPAGRATSRWIRCRTEGRRGVGREGGGKERRRVVEVVRGPVGKRRSIITTVPAHGDLSPRARIYSFCVRGPYYEYNGRGYAVLPGVDIRS